MTFEELYKKSLPLVEKCEQAFDGAESAEEIAFALQLMLARVSVSMNRDADALVQGLAINIPTLMTIVEQSVSRAELLIKYAGQLALPREPNGDN